MVIISYVVIFPIGDHWYCWIGERKREDWCIRSSVYLRKSAEPRCMSDASLSYTWTDHESTVLIYSSPHPQATYRRREGKKTPIMHFVPATHSTNVVWQPNTRGSHWDTDRHCGGWKWHQRKKLASHTMLLLLLVDTDRALPSYRRFGFQWLFTQQLVES